MRQYIACVLIIFLLYLVIKRKIAAPSVIHNFDITQTPFKELEVKRQDHVLLHNIMKRLNRAFEDYNQKYIFIAGSLLGAVRYQNRMPWDDDIDIGVFDTFIEKMDLKKYGLGLRKVFFGYKVFDLNHNYSKKLESTFPFVDVFIFENKLDRYQYTSGRARYTWPNEYIMKSEIEDIVKIEYDGEYYPTMKNYLSFLNRVFPDWDKTAYVISSHTGDFIFRNYKMPINEKTTNQVMKYLSTL